ncbi:DUF6262 family protein [Paenibacillus sp. LHD-38]|uniref:DUF6262 family protein n=1 Tax=Paenibacillus sp. LHD-38 TaxID=3072143 RepID=UPI00280FFF44|nr:DUF6262 family protein [Paenibacillus sp. LHD-38]MDQ8735806.1 DUF6262 family protein [Paenibacillus sp. LHD-38]
MANQSPDMSGIAHHAKTKSEVTIKKVDDAIKRTIKKQVSINFNTVSKESNVSTAYLYSQKAIRERIKHLRGQQEGLSSIKKVKRNMSDPSKAVIIESLRNRVQTLEKENEDLKRKLSVFLGQQYNNL